MQRLIAIAALALALGACSGTTANNPGSNSPAQPTVVTSAERWQHYRDVVADMNCDDLATFEQRRLAASFNDNQEALTAIHDRQASLDCPS
jgi:hypothetical protein